MEDLHTKRIVVNMQIPNRDLCAGYTQLVSENAAEMFGSEKVVITGIDCTALSSDASKSISLGFNIGNGRADNSEPIPNGRGDLYHPVVTDMSNDHQANFQGFQNCLSVMPFEKYRGSAISCYAPSSDMDDRMLQEYGALSMDELWTGVVPFSGENYFYVEQGCTVDKVLARNWDQLGINRDAANLIENKYTKVDGKRIVLLCDWIELPHLLSVSFSLYTHTQTSHTQRRPSTPVSPSSGRRSSPRSASPTPPTSASALRVT